MRSDHLVTAEDLERMGERGRWLELVQGELVTMNPPGGEHGALAALLAAELIAHVNPRHLGRVYCGERFRPGSESGYRPGSGRELRVS